MEYLITALHKVIAENVLDDYFILPMTIKKPKKAHQLLAKLNINTNAYIKTSDLRKVLKCIRAEVIQDNIVWYDKKTNEVIAIFNIWKKLKDTTKTLLKKGGLVLVTFTLLAGSASAKAKKKADDLKSSYIKSIEMVGKDLGLDLDVDVTKKSSGALTKVLVDLTNTATGNQIKVQVIYSADGQYMKAKIKQFPRASGVELDDAFDAFGYEIHESLQDQILSKGLKK